MPDAAFFARAGAASQRLMVDACVIARDPDFVDDSTLDTETGDLEPGSTVTVYSGKCLVAPVTRQDYDAEEGGAPLVRGRYRATIPLESDEVVIGDVLTVTASQHDVMLVGKSFTVRSVPCSTNAFHRRLLMDLTTRADAQ